MSYYDHFAKQSSTFIGKWVKRRARERQVSLLKPFFPHRNCAILEIGAGMGECATICFQAGYTNYTAVEPNSIMRERLAKRNIKVKDYLIPHLNEADESYDAIILFHVFEHLNGPRDAKTFIHEAQRVLRPHGILCILSPDYLHWKEHFFNGDYTHNNVTTVRRTLQLFQDSGFSVLTWRYFSGFFSGWLATVVSYLIQFGLFFSNGNYLDDKLYKLKGTFLRSFLIVGKRSA